MSTDSLAPNAIDALFDALSSGDIPAALACFTPDAVIWHGFDRVEHDLASITGDWAALVKNFATRAFVDVNRQATASGFVQQHVMSVTTATGHRMAWPICIVVSMDGPLIARFDEYIDRAGFYTPADAPEVSAA